MAFCVTETAAEPPVREQDVANWRELVRQDVQRAAQAAGWGWKNSQIKQTEGWGGDQKEEAEPAQPPPQDPPQDPPVTTTIVPILVPDEPEDENEPPVIITEGPVTTTKGKGWHSNDNGHDTLMIYGGDAEKEKAVDWGNEGYKQLRMAETWESRKMESTQGPNEEIPAEIENEVPSKGEGSPDVATGGWKSKGSKGAAAATKKGKKAGSKASAQYKPDNYGLHSGVQPVYVRDW